MTDGMLAVAIMKEILDKGLAKSTWKDKYDVAYADLLKLRRDMELSVLKVLYRQRA